MLPQWLSAGARTDVELARSRALDRVQAVPPSEPLPEWLDRALLAIIEAARRTARA
jgi:hypothetical protein